MKKTIISFGSALMLLCATIAFAQSPANRTSQTIIADVLAQMPANTQQDYNRQMVDLASTGEAGINALLQKINAPGKGSNAQVDYALSGLTHYVSAKGREAERQTTINAYKKAIAAASTGAETKAFLTEQLRMLGDAIESAPASLFDGVQKVTKSSPVHLRIAALQGEIFNLATKKDVDAQMVFIMADLPTIIPLDDDAKKALSKKVLEILKDPSAEYRNAGLNFVSPFASKELYVSLVAALPKMKPEVKADVINFLGREAKNAEKRGILASVETKMGVASAQVIAQELVNADWDVKYAAAWALVRLNQPSAIVALAALLKNADQKTVDLAADALASFNGNISDEVARAIPSAADKGKIACLKLLAARKASSHLTDVLSLVKSDDSAVKAEAYKTLKDVVGEKDLTNLCGMLESAPQQYVAPLQQAVIAAIASQPKPKQVETLVRRMDSNDAKKSLYYLPLASTGDSKALALITDGFSKGAGEAKNAAFDALLAWKGFETADALYDICKNPSAGTYFDNALTAYVKLVSNPSLTGENRFIYLRKAMEIAKTDAQKNAILTQISQTGTFLALLYAGEFLNQPALKEKAAQAVMNIALNHPEYAGENVAALLTQTAAALNNPDADYQRQSIRKFLDEMPKGKGFAPIFNGKDLTGWKGLVENPIARGKMKPAELAKKQVKADEVMRSGWVVEDGMLVFTGKGDNICTDKLYGDFEMYVDWKLDPAGHEPDAGIYLRGAPQVQIWDTSRVNVGAQVGSGGLYNNQANSKPLKVADNKLGEWNTFYIKMTGDRVTVKLNGEVVTDDVILENYWDRKLPIFPIEQIELQAHGSKVWYRNIYVKELDRPEPYSLSAEEQKEGYKILFDGTNMYEWTGNLVNYTIENGCIVMDPDKTGDRSHGNLFTKNEYGNFVFRFEFQLTPGANNGLGIRTPMEGDAAYVGMELQILDNEAPIYSDLAPYQYHGSVYGVIAAKRGYLKPTGEWNYEEVVADGDHIKITLNGTVILDGNIREASKNGTADGKEHPGLLNPSGHIGFLGHGSPLKFRNIRIKTLK